MASIPHIGNRWTAEETNHLRRLCARNTLAGVVRKFGTGRSKYAIKAQIKRMGISPLPTPRGANRSGC